MTSQPTSSASVREAGSEGTFSHLPMRVRVAGGVMILMGLVTTLLMVQDVSTASYIYLAFYSIPANTAISLFPHEPVLLYFGTVGGILPAALVATAGTVVAGYLDHTVFVPILNHEKIIAYKEKNLYRTGIRYFKRWPFATLLVTGFSPIPFLPFKVLSFSIHYPMGKYILTLALARFPRYLLLAWAGAALNIPNWLIILLFVVMISLYFVRVDLGNPGGPSNSSGDPGKSTEAPGEPPKGPEDLVARPEGDRKSVV